MYRPSKAESVGKNQRYSKLELPQSWKIHCTFNIVLRGRYRGQDPKNRVVEIEDDNARWEMEPMIASGTSDDNLK